MSFEKMREHSQTETQRMLDRLEKRVKGRPSENVTENIIGTLDEGLRIAKSLNLDDFSPGEIAALTNPWKAWNNQVQDLFDPKNPKEKAIQETLQRLVPAEGQSLPPDVDPSLATFVRQLWRTEMVAYVIKKIKTNKAETMLKVLETQEVPLEKSTPSQALLTASRIDRVLSSKQTRAEIARHMNRQEEKSMHDLNDVILSPQWNVKSVKIVIGGELVDFPLEHTFLFEFRNFAQYGNRYYAQMKNGCKGNLVIIDLEKRKEETRPEPLPSEPGPAVNPPWATSAPREPILSEQPITPLPPLDTLRVRTANIMEYATSPDLISEGRTEHNILPEVRKLRELLGVFSASRNPAERKNLLQNISSRTTDLRANIGLVKGEADELLGFLKRTKREKAEELSPSDRKYLDERISDLTRLTQTLNFIRDTLVHIAPRLITLEQEFEKHNYTVSLTALSTLEDLLKRFEDFLVRPSKQAEEGTLMTAGAIHEEMSVDEKRAAYRQLMAGSAYDLGYDRDEEHVGLDKLKERFGGESATTKPYEMMGYRGIKTLLDNARTSTFEREKANLLNTAYYRLIFLHEETSDTLGNLQRQYERFDNEILSGIAAAIRDQSKMLPETERTKMMKRGRVLRQAVDYCEKLLLNLSELAREILNPDLDPYLKPEQRARLKKEFGY